MRWIIFVLSILFCCNNIAFASVNNAKDQFSENLKMQALQRNSSGKQAIQYNSPRKKVDDKKLYTIYAPSDYFFKNLLSIEDKKAYGRINELIQRNAHKSTTPTSIGYAAILPLIINQNIDFLRAIYKSKSLDFAHIKIDVFGNNVLHLLILAGWQEGINFIKDKYKKQYSRLLNTKNNYGITPQKLLTKLQNKQSNTRNLVGFDHLLVFAILSKNKEVITLLEPQAKDKKKQFYSQPIDNFGNRILHIMAASGYTNGVKQVVKKCNLYGLDLGNITNKNGFTAAHIAAAMNYSKIIDVLLNITTYMPERTQTPLGTPLHIAIRNYGLYNFEKKEAVRTIWILIRYVSEEVLSGNRRIKYTFLNIPDGDGNMPLHLAAMRAKFKVVLYLLSAGSDPRLYNNQKQTPSDVTGTSLFKDKIQIDALRNFISRAEQVAKKAGNSIYKLTPQQIAEILEKNEFKKTLFNKLNDILRKSKISDYKQTISEQFSKYLSTKPSTGDEAEDIPHKDSWIGNDVTGYDKLKIGA